jgi:hypothetical protein
MFKALALGAFLSAGISLAAVAKAEAPSEAQKAVIQAYQDSVFHMVSPPQARDYYKYALHEPQQKVLMLINRPAVFFRSLTVRPAPQWIFVSDQKVVVHYRERLDANLVNAKTKRQDDFLVDSEFEDTWAKTAAGWRLVSYKTLSSHITRNHQSITLAQLPKSLA